MSKIAVVTTLSIACALTGCSNSNSSTVIAYGCGDWASFAICNGKPTYLGEISFIVSKEGKSIKVIQSPAKGQEQLKLIEGVSQYGNCTITDQNNWSCKNPSPIGGATFIHEMVDGFYMTSIIKGSNINATVGAEMDYVGYQGIKGQLIKYGLWQPTDIFKEGKATP